MMASRKKNIESLRSVSKSIRRHGNEAVFSSSSSSDDTEMMATDREWKNIQQEKFDRSCVEMDQQTGQDTPRREENPFSFKHFLKKGTQTNYYNTGARPKVYSSPTSSSSDLEKDTGVYSRNPTELPDFVQDHLVIEQCYLNHESNQQTMPDVDNLPDFALNSVEQRQTRLRNRSKKCGSDDFIFCDFSFDFATVDKGAANKENPGLNAACSTAHLDLPGFDKPAVEPVERSESTDFPFDLPLPLAESDTSANVITRDSETGEAGVPKSLPDFLSDGPIHNRTTLSTESGSNSNMTESTERQLLLENERLRRELELAWKQISERSKRIELLEAELASRREVEHEETAHLEKAMEQVEDNLKRSTKRAVNAESTVTSLKKEIKLLRTNISLLRLENKELKASMSTGSRNEYGVSSNVDRTIRRLACDLRTAASTAEVSLRQLMSGVDNLRVLASTLENVDRMEDRTKDFLPDFDEDNAAGPAL